MTEKLYDADSHLREFDATVVACEPVDGHFRVELDRTAFFPEEGGQSCDAGVLGETDVLYVSENDGIVFHDLAEPLTVGSKIHGKIDWTRRFHNMQNHTGEHIVSGLIHRLYGLDNVGFHLSDAEVTLDVNGELSEEDLTKVEYLANEAVFRNVSVTTVCPQPEQLDKMTFRSKLDLTENVRVVVIDSYDACACCAPHVSRTGEIGLIKILDFMRYKKGTRIFMRCGFDAWADYNRKCKHSKKISVLLSAEQDQLSQAVETLMAELETQKARRAQLAKRVAELSVQAPCQTRNKIVFEPLLSGDELRMIVNAGMEDSAICAAFSGTDRDGYRYVCGSLHTDMREFSKVYHRALNGKGGGSAKMIQGSVDASQEQIQAFFDGVQDE